MAVVLSICVLPFTLPAWRPIILRQPISTASLKPILSLTLSSLLQIAFIVLVEKQILTLTYSLKFAAWGVPFCVLALVLARGGTQPNNPLRGAIIGASLGLVMWMFLITIH